ncbi:expressed unknown protein [Seminavis robusta]|uniref:Uncharacterized protein n=1 Tax=Seminavis robusta TaxID=568900 RepID=A0A9N8H7H3_9STRA|nr:expressed unknown protein [Seminavis robusta]|eukprot:Sro129_g061570.1 n/a (123) ;mRNA; f:56714-57082
MAMLYHYVHKTELQAAQWDFELAHAKKMVEQSLRADGTTPNNQQELLDQIDSYHDSSRQHSNASVGSWTSSRFVNIISSSNLSVSSISSIWKRSRKQRKKKKEFRKSKIVARQAYRYVGVFM